MADVRLRKVESLLKEEISGLISRRVIKDPRLAPLTTITGVRVSRDLHFAKVYVSLYGEGQLRDQSVDALNHASGFIHTMLRKSIRLRFIPKLTFFADDSIERGVRLTNKIRNLPALSVDGQILVDKPAGLTSFTALRGLKHALQTGRIGHTGTLDKFATGLLVVLIGKYTKLADLFSGLDKCYRATVVFGRTTDTLDPEGEYTGEGPLPALPSIEEAAVRLTGTIEQVPPLYSAVHVEGQRAYRVVRRGGKPKLEARTVTVYRIEIMDYRSPELDIVVDCSKGTYVRALARDLGALCGSCAYLSALRRSRVGPYSVEEAVSVDTLPEAELLAGSLQRLSRLPGLGAMTVKGDAVSGVRNGRNLGDSLFTTGPKTDGLYTLLDPKGDLLALATRERGKYHYKMVM